MPEYDMQDCTIVSARERQWNYLPGARVGDFVKLPEGAFRRVAHDWGDSLQLTSQVTGHGTFYLASNGAVAHSGGLDPGIPREHFRDLGEQRQGYFWIFHHDRPRAHNAVYFHLPCRLFEVVESEAEAWARQQGEALAAAAGTRDHDRVGEAKPDPRDPRPDHEMVGRDAIFRNHNCYRCNDGTKPCVKGNPRSCDTLHARND